MKISILALGLILFGCDARLDYTYEKGDPIVVTSKEAITLYPGECWFGTEISESVNILLTDSCKCHDVGDTLVLVKKQR